MKKLFSIAILFTLTFGAVVFSTANVKAQTTLAQTDPAGASATVNTNADTSYHLIDMAGNNNNFKYLNFVIKGTKTSGTVAGAITLWGSIDNSRFFPVYAQTNASSVDTTTSIALTDASVDACFIVSGTKWRYYRVRVITTGTQVSSYVVKLLGRKVEN